MPRTAWSMVILLLAVALAGCFQQGQTEGLEAQEGDFVRIHYVARYQSNGTVLESSYNGTWPAGQDITDVPAEDHLPGQFWVYMWHESTAQNTTGRGLITDVNFRDLDEDGFRESMIQTREDILRQNGTSVRENENTTLWHVPPRVTGDPNVMVQGVFETLLGRRAGDVIQDEAIPPEKAYGAPSPQRVRDLPRTTQGRTRNLTDQPLTQVRARSNLTAETRAGDVIGYKLFNSTAVDAEVTSINRSQDHVSLYLMLTNGTSVEVPDLWTATVVNVTELHYGLRHNPTVGEDYRLPGSGRDVPFTVVSVNETHMKLDFNDPRAGETIVYDIEVLDVVRPGRADRGLVRGPSVDPFSVDNTVHDIAMMSPGTLVVATAQGAYLSTDFGRTWFPFDREVIGPSVRVMEASKTEPGGALVSVADRGVLATDDMGLTWREGRGLGPGSVTAVAHSTSRPDVAYALVQDDGIYRSQDAAGNWTKVSDSLTRAHGLAVDPGDTETLWAATGGGLRKSTDRGQSWTIDAFDGQPVQDVDVMANGSLFALVGHGFNVSWDGGETWEAGGGAGRQMSSVAHSRRAPNRLVAANASNGLFFSQDHGQLWVTLRR